MKIKKYIAGSVLFLAMLACVIPGLSQPAAPPAFDPNTISTMVVLTANAAISQTAVAAVPPAGTSAPEMKGTAIEQLQDGATKYSDYDAGFEVTYPVGWLAVRPNSDEFNTALANDGDSNTLLRDQMTADLAGYDAKLDRLYSYVLRSDIEKNTIFGFSKLVWGSEDATSIDDATMGELIRELESSGVVPGLRIDAAQVHENSNAVRMIEIGGRYTISDGQGGSIPFHVKGIFFKPTPGSTTRITFTFLQDYSAQISADVKSIVDSIHVIGQ